MSRIQDHHPNSLLLVEGNDDFHVIHSLCKQFNISVRNLENPKGNFSVKDCKGVTELLEQIPVLFKSPKTSLGIIIDADIDLQSRWESVKNILLKEGFDVPKDLPENGLIVKKGILKAGVWIMPNNNLWYA